MSLLDPPLSKRAILTALGQDPAKSNVLTTTLSNGVNVFDDDLAAGLAMQHRPATPQWLHSIIALMYPDPDAEAAISAAGVTDTKGKTHYRTIIAAIKSLDLWAAFNNGFLFGSVHQPSATTLKSLRAGAADATGTGTQTAYGVSLNGTSNRYVYASATANASKSAKTLVAVFLDSNTATTHVSHVFSGYAGGTNRGPAIYCGGSSISGTTGTLGRVYGYASSDGAASVPELYQTSAAAGNITYSALRLKDGWLSLFTHGKESVHVALATMWQNYTQYGIGASASGAGTYMAGSMYCVLEFDAALSDEQLQKLFVVLRTIFGVVSASNRFLLFTGNSLTDSAAGGGTNWPSKLLAKPAWSSAFPATAWANNALSGSWVSQYGELDYYMRGQMWAPVVGERSIVFAWDGCNDITGGASAATIIAAKDRLYSAMLRDGWELYVIAITPVAKQGQGMSYGWTSAQQVIRDQVNAWMQNNKRFRFIDLSKIGVANPTFLDPTSSDYYVAGDGLHHNDAGRVLIADYIASVVTL